MKSLKLGDKILYILNVIIALFLLLSYVLPYISPKASSILSVLSLLVPIFILLNIIFILLWVLQLKKQFLLSLIVLVIGLNHVQNFYQFKGKDDFNLDTKEENKLKVLSYNVRLFNLYEWLKKDGVGREISNLVLQSNADVICFQEFHPSKQLKLSKTYPYKFSIEIGNNKFGQAIYSKFPILNRKSIRFENSSNALLYIDVLKGKDTIRIYNMHLESLGLNPSSQNFGERDSEKLIKKIENSFIKQEEQLALFKENLSNCRYPKILCVDLNNTAFSHVYKNIIDLSLKDSYQDKGFGFGRTYNFMFFPMRIDFIFTSEEFKVVDFETGTQKLSDHFPISATLKLQD